MFVKCQFNCQFKMREIMGIFIVVILSSLTIATVYPEDVTLHNFVVHEGPQLNEGQGKFRFGAKNIPKPPQSYQIQTGPFHQVIQDESNDLTGPSGPTGLDQFQNGQENGPTGSGQFQQNGPSVTLQFPVPQNEPSGPSPSQFQLGQNGGHQFHEHEAIAPPHFIQNGPHPVQPQQQPQLPNGPHQFQQQNGPILLKSPSIRSPQYKGNRPQRAHGQRQFKGHQGHQFQAPGVEDNAVDTSNEIVDDQFKEILSIMDEMAVKDDHESVSMPGHPVHLRPLEHGQAHAQQNHNEHQHEHHHLPLGQTHGVNHHKGSNKEKYHSCYRICSSDPASRMTCSFNFTVANYYSLSPHCYECPNITSDCSRHGCLPTDGRPRAVAVVNKMMPGPGIRVCEGDTVVVDLHNKLVGQETTIHWHGIHQRDTPWMDGVPKLTQCGIPEGNKFRYRFDVPKAGTYFWHSHAGVQRADGIFGPLIVRRAPDVDVHTQLFDFDLAEHEIIVMDWLSGLALSGHIVGHVTDERELPRSILVNGRGFPRNFFDDIRPYESLQNVRKPFVPIHEARIQREWSYRFRLISNGVTLCPIEFSIENHPLLVIASDGIDVMPVLVQSLVIHAGERFDVVVRGDQQIGSYWMKYRGQIDCANTSTYQLGVLNYDGMPKGSLPRHTITTWEAAGPAVGIQLNPVNVAPGIPGESITIAEMSSVVDDDPQIIKQLVPDHQFYLSYDFNPVPNVNFGKPAYNKSIGQLRMERASLIHFLPQLNYISHTMPMAPPLTQPETISSMQRCNAESKRAENIDCTKKHCKCNHWLNVKLNSIVEIVLVDMGLQFDAAHPFHLHGHSFRVVSLERLGNSTDPQFVKQWDAQGLIPRRRAKAPIKDTVYVPDGGYTIIRFRANNPGFWLFHCHIEFHNERGMAAIIQVGEPTDPRPPPPDFPRCGNYLPHA